MENIKQQLSTIIKDLYGLEVTAEVTPAPENQRSTDGRRIDYATNVAFQLSKQLKKSPRDLASEIAEKIEEFDIEVASPGFLNFISSDDYFKKRLANLSENFEETIACGLYKDKVIVSEFSDPNPFKVLHVGHLYTSIVGEAISKLLEFAGGEVHRANFGGDVGLHVARTMYALLPKKSEFKPDLSPAEKAEFLAKCYVEGTRANEDDEAAHEEIVKLNKEIYRIAENGLGAPATSSIAPHNSPSATDAADPTNATEPAASAGPTITFDPDLASLYWDAREASYAYFEDFYSSIGLKFEKYYPESTVAPLGLAVIKEQLKNGVYEESDGAVVFRGEPCGLHTRVFINKAGLPTYEAKDVGLIHKKWDDYHFDRSLVITGNDIIDYMKVVLKSVEQYNPTLVDRTVHLTHGNVKLAGGVKMSSRKGNFLKAVDVLNLVRSSLSSSDEIETISLGATKYAFLKYKIGGNIIFDPKESVSMTGNSGPYLQYAAVRAKKVLSSLPSTSTASSAPLASPSPNATPSSENPNWALSTYERELIKKLLEYKDVLAEAVTDLAPHKICSYLYELAQVFNRFYENDKVLGSPFEAERVRLVSLYLKTLTHGLFLLGIQIPEKM